ncbi:MAG: ATP-binding protein [Acidobacteriota bacterium]
MPRRGLDQRTEVSLLLPLALLILVLLSTFTLFAYRSTVQILLEERRTEAEGLAKVLRADLAAGAWPRAEDLARRVPGARSVLVLDDRGRPALAAGSPRSGEPGIGVPGGEGTSGVIGEAGFRRGDMTYTVRVDLPAPILRSRERSLSILTPLLLSVEAGILLLVLIYLRRLLVPLDRVLERARDLGHTADSGREVADLVRTFEEALDALARPGQDDLSVLEGALTQSLESGVLLCDGEGKVLALNQVGAEILGVKAPSTPTPLAQVLAPHPDLASVLGRAVVERTSLQREEQDVVTAAGDRTLGLTAHPLRRDDGEVRGYLVLFADLTDARREMEQERLSENLLQLGELAAGVAHEMRNSLATLRGFLTLIEKGPGEEALVDYLAEIRHESDHLQRVLEDFLSFARPGSVRLQEVDLLSLAHRAAADPALGGAAVTVTAQGDVDPMVSGDPQLLERALRNLLSNGFESQRAAEVDDPLEVRLGNVDGGISIEVLDRGGGLDPALEGRFFSPFVSGRANGVGMGLALTRRILLLHQGRLELLDRDGGGARASLWLPSGKNVTDRSVSG